MQMGTTRWQRIGQHALIKVLKLKLESHRCIRGENPMPEADMQNQRTGVQMLSNEKRSTSSEVSSLSVSTSSTHLHTQVFPSLDREVL